MRWVLWLQIFFVQTLWCGEALRAFVTMAASPAATKPPKLLPKKVIASNKKARFTYEIIRTYEAGIALVGTEVKSCRSGKVALRDAFGRIQKNTVWLHNCDIAAHVTTATWFQHESKRPRQLLLHKSEVKKLKSEMDANRGLTLVPLSFYFNEKNKLKVDLALCKGKNLRDKRASIKERDEKKTMGRISKITASF